MPDPRSTYQNMEHTHCEHGTYLRDDHCLACQPVQATEPTHLSDIIEANPDLKPQPIDFYNEGKADKQAEIERIIEDSDLHAGAKRYIIAAIRGDNDG